MVMINVHLSLDVAHEASSSHDEYDPDVSRTPPNRASLLESDIYTTPSHRSSQPVSGRTQEAIENFYDHIYKSRLCLMSQRATPIAKAIAHVVKRSSTPKEVQ